MYPRENDLFFASFVPSLRKEQISGKRNQQVYEIFIGMRRKGILKRFTLTNKLLLKLKRKWNGMDIHLGPPGPGGLKLSCQRLKEKGCFLLKGVMWMSYGVGLGSVLSQ